MTVRSLTFDHLCHCKRLADLSKAPAAMKVDSCQSRSSYQNDCFDVCQPSPALATMKVDNCQSIHLHPCKHLELINKRWTAAVKAGHHETAKLGNHAPFRAFIPRTPPPYWSVSVYCSRLPAFKERDRWFWCLLRRGRRARSRARCFLLL